MVSTDTVVTIGAGLVLGGSVVLGWWYTWGTWQELRTDWQDFRTAAASARENRRERETFAAGKACSECRAPVNPRRLYRAVRSEHAVAPPSRWVYRCRCGESTIYDVTGRGRHLAPASAH